MNKVFNKFKEVRKLLGLSQAGMAELCDVHQSDVSKYEKGKLNIPVSVIQILNKKGYNILEEDKPSTFIHNNNTVSENKDPKDIIISLQEQVISHLATIRILEARIKELEQTGVSDSSAKSA